MPIINEVAVRGKDRIDLTVDPPPDLALEVDVTSRTHPNIYEALGVPELWRFEQGNLQINILQNGKYIISETTQIFPNLPVADTIIQFLNQSKTLGRNKAMKDFRAWVRKQICI